MKNYLLEIVVIVFIMAISSLILSEGRLKFFIKSIYSITLILVIISPIIKMKNTEVNFDLFLENEIVFDQNFLDYVNNKKDENYKEILDKILLNMGINRATFEFVLDKEENSIEKIFIDLKNAVIENKDEHINIVKEIEDKIKEHYFFSNAEVIFL
ncbi:MAG: hypothetical protein E7342_02510 [Clostridiales bacterium]|nr:hypothetical protein [Clostridiales bacterium]